MATKKRRVITSTETFSLLESTADELVRAQEALSPAMETAFDGLLSAAKFVDLVKEGKLQTATIAIEGKPSCILFFQVNPSLGWLYIEGAAAIERTPIHRIFEGVDALAGELKSKAVVFVTKYSALLRAALDRGYNNAGVVMFKPRQR